MNRNRYGLTSNISNANENTSYLLSPNKIQEYQDRILKSYDTKFSKKLVREKSVSFFWSTFFFRIFSCGSFLLANVLSTIFSDLEMCS